MSAEVVVFQSVCSRAKVLLHTMHAIHLYMHVMQTVKNAKISFLCFSYIFLH